MLITSIYILEFMDCNVLKIDKKKLVFILNQNDHDTDQLDLIEIKNDARVIMQGS